MGDTDPVEERLYGLLEVIEQQQRAVQQALEGLEAERAALARERAALAGEVRRLTPGLRMDVMTVVSTSLEGMSSQGTQALQAAVTPLLGAVGKAAAQAGKAEKALEAMSAKATRHVTLSWFGWVAGLVVLGWAASHVLLWYDARDIEDQRATKAALTSEIAGLKADRDAWAQVGMPGKLVRCGPDHRPCVAVDENAEHYENGTEQYRVILGY